jgi:lysophospholipase L1-like esterase
MEFKNGNNDPETRHKILVFGDSMVSGLEVYLEDSFTCTYFVESFPGTLAKDFATKDLDMFRWSVEKYKPNVLVLCLGTNDLGHGLTPQETLAHMHFLVSESNLLGVKKVVVCLLHSWQKMFNSLLLLEVMQKHNKDKLRMCDFLQSVHRKKTDRNLCVDGLHLTPTGRAHFANSLQEILETQEWM